MTDQKTPASESSDDNIYKAPAVDTTPTPGDNLYAVYVGPKNADYYLAKFAIFESGGSRVSWNWPAFLISSVWLLYRKMWLNAFLYWLALPIGLAVLSAVVDVMAGAVASTVFYYASYVLITFILVPMFANWLYYRHVQQKVDGITSSPPAGEDAALALARKGGTSNVVLVVLPFFFIFVVGILAAIAIPAYQDYTIRAQISEGLNLSGNAQAAVATEFMSSGVLPRDNAGAGLLSPGSISGTYVSSVEIIDGDVVITYGNNANAVIHGQTIVLTPQVSDSTGSPANALTWSCGSESIVPKHLPAACR